MKSLRWNLHSLKASQGLDRSGGFPVSYSFGFFPSSSPLQQMVNWKSLSAGGGVCRGRGFKPRGPLWTWLIWQDCYTCTSLIKYAAETEGWICKAAWNKETDEIGDFYGGAGRAAWQQRCGDRDKKAKVSLMTFQRTPSRCNSCKLSSYNETHLAENGNNNGLMLNASRTGENYYFLLV